jgi:hypothetical protein
MSPPQNPSPKSRPALVTPRYVSFGLFAGVIASGLAIAYIAPKYFAAKPQPGGESVPDCWALVVLWFTAWLWWVFPSRVRSVTGKVTDTTPKYILVSGPFLGRACFARSLQLFVLCHSLRAPYCLCSLLFLRPPSRFSSF